MVDLHAFGRRHRDSLVVLAEMLVFLVALSAVLWLVFTSPDRDWVPAEVWLAATAGFVVVWFATVAMGAFRHGVLRRTTNSRTRWAAIVNSVATGAFFSFGYLPRAVADALEGDLIRAAVGLMFGCGFLLSTAWTVRKLLREVTPQSGQ